MLMYESPGPVMAPFVVTQIPAINEELVEVMKEEDSGLLQRKNSSQVCEEMKSLVIDEHNGLDLNRNLDRTD